MKSFVTYYPTESHIPIIIPQPAITTLQPSYDKDKEEWILEIFTTDSYVTCIPTGTKKRCLDLINTICAAIKQGKDIDIDLAEY
ncbi:MAG: hypothetical protein PHQ97_15115 [Desulfobacterales bacterium]|nr:hypothetical protein [Desulfobacterales bacterium]